MPKYHFDSLIVVLRFCCWFAFYDQPNFAKLKQELYDLVNSTKVITFILG